MVLPPESVLLMPSCLSEQDQDDWLERRERNQMRSWSIKSLLPATVTLTPADTAGSTAGERVITVLHSLLFCTTGVKNNLLCDLTEP
ncbi:hypothetical protein JOQ06_009456 [Pogonophryne albipinna]|uniref:Uncharacterized protein n=1 Tax=Pogonophryne albipinna TaxID=1090488 RepID=A0AAD6BLI8_9TELE|nr:hypothetical protein JOQ06_009456 [Pogonophryne albipinna]